MVVTNTFRHTSENPRFRAVLFTSECITRQVYKLIYQGLADKLVEAGYSVDRKDKTRRTSSFSNSRPHEIPAQLLDAWRNAFAKTISGASRNPK
jgi:hypothetical protein